MGKVRTMYTHINEYLAPFYDGSANLGNSHPSMMLRDVSNLADSQPILFWFFGKRSIVSQRAGSTCPRREFHCPGTAESRNSHALC